MCLGLGFILLILIIGLSAPVFAAGPNGAPELLIFFSKEMKQLVFKQYPEGGQVDSTVSSKEDKKFYSAVSIPTPGHTATVMSATGTKESFKNDGKKIIKYENRFKSIKHGDVEKKYWFKYELVGRFEKDAYYQRYKVDDKVYMMVRYDYSEETSYVYEREKGHLVLINTVPGSVTLLVRTKNWFMEPFVDLEI